MPEAVNCNAVQFEIETDLTSALQCDCSLCKRKNAIIHRVPKEQFRLTKGKDDLTILRIDWPAAMPREISSRSSSLSADTALRRGAGAIPPWRATIPWTPVLFRLSSAREMAAALCPFFQRSHRSACCAVNQIRDVTIRHPLIQ
jgi:hypothetical protein